MGYSLTSLVLTPFCPSGLLGLILSVNLSLRPGQLAAQNNNQRKSARLLDRVGSLVFICGSDPTVCFQSHLDWWPKIDTVYCYSAELRFMFSDTKSRVIQAAGAHPPVRITPVSCCCMTRLRALPWSEPVHVGADHPTLCECG